MSKIRLTTATFDASAQTITATQFSDVGLAGIQLITNVTDNIVVYSFADPTKGGALVGDVLTLDYDTTTMSDTDDLMILVEDGVQTTVVSATDLDIRPLVNTDVVTAELSAVDNAVLDTIDAVLDTIKTDTAALVVDAAASEALLTTIDADTSALVTSNDAIKTAVEIIDNAISGTEMQVDVVAPLPAGTNNIGDVDVLSSALPTGASTLAEQQTQTTALQLLDDTVFADDAAFTLGTSKGSVIEGIAVATDGTDPTAVSAEGDAAAVRTDLNRILLVNQTHPRGTTVSADYASAQTNVSVIAAPGASLSIYITDIQLSNGATAGNVTLLDGSGGTVKWEAYPAINGGAVLNLRQPIKLTANTALCLTSTSVTTHSIFIGYYIAA